MAALQSATLRHLAKALISASRSSVLLFQTSKGLSGLTP